MFLRWSDKKYHFFDTIKTDKKSDDENCWLMENFTLHVYYVCMK